MVSCAPRSLEERPCPVCNSRAQKLFAEECIDSSCIGDYTYASRKEPEFMCLRLVQCLDCSVIYAPVPPSREFLDASYAGAAYDSGEEAACAARSYAKSLARHLPRLQGRGLAVDVGAGNGALLPWLRKAGFAEVMGIEPSLAAIEAAEPDVRPMLHEGLFSASMLAGREPSLLCSFMTLEHMDDPGAFVHTAHAALEPDGMLAVVVHDWQAALNRLLGKRSPIIDVEHLQLFSMKSVHILLRRAGFVDISMENIRNRYPLRYWLRLTPLPGALKRGVAGLLNATGTARLQLSFPVGNILAVGLKTHSSR